MDRHETGDTREQVVARVDEVLCWLNADPSRLCEASGGQPIRLALLLSDPEIEIRIVVMADGTAVRVTDESLLGESHEGFAPQMTMRGAARDLADIARAETGFALTIHDSSLRSDVGLRALDAVRELLDEHGRGDGAT